MYSDLSIYAYAPFRAIHTIGDDGNDACKNTPLRFFWYLLSDILPPYPPRKMGNEGIP